MNIYKGTFSHVRTHRKNVCAARFHKYKIRATRRLFDHFGKQTYARQIKIRDIRGLI